MDTNNNTTNTDNINNTKSNKTIGIAVALIVIALIGALTYFQPWAEKAAGSDNQPSTPGSPLTGATVVDDIVPESTPEEQAQTPELLPADVEYDIVAKGMKFTPAVINAKKGQRVRLHVTAEDRTYGFEIAEFHFKDTVYRGETKTVDIVPDKYGTFIFFSRREWNDGKIGELGRLVVTLN